MRLEAEVVGRFETAGDCAKLLYVPPEEGLTFRRSRCYALGYDGDPEAVKRFVATVLFDPISQDLHFGDEPAIAGAALILDYGMKPTALDLEKETVLRYHRELEEPGFVFTELTIRTRLYIFAAAGGGAGGRPAGSPVSPEPFLRDVVNPAIHSWRIAHA